MNKVFIMGRLTRDPQTRYSQGQNQIAVSRYTLAVDRRSQSGQQADYIPCVALGKQGEFAEKYLRKGMKIAVEGRIKTGSYTNRDGQKVYTVEVMVESHEFAEGKRNVDGSRPEEYGLAAGGGTEDSDGFMNIPEGIDEELPFA